MEALVALMPAEVLELRALAWAAKLLVNAPAALILAAIAEAVAIVLSPG